MMELSHAQHAAVGEAIRRAEMRTRAEIVCVVAARSGEPALEPHLWASCLALAVPWLLMMSTSLSVQAIFAVQLVAFVAVLLLLSAAPVGRCLSPRALLRARVHRAAAEQFVTRGMIRTSGRAGVLIYVSLAERQMRILADEAVNACISRTEWQEIVALCVAELREERLAEGLVAAVTRCGDLLALRLPDDGSPRNELPDRVYLM